MERHTRRCRRCNKPVGASRYFYCKYCVPTGHEDEMYVAHEFRRRAQSPIPSTKTCNKCMLIRYMDEFKVKTSNKDGRHGTCRECHKIVDIKPQNEMMVA